MNPLEQTMAFPTAVSAQANTIRPPPRPRFCVAQQGHSKRDCMHPQLAASQDGEEAGEEEVLDMAIVGAGPAGLALAIGLLEKGLRVKVFEAAPEIKERGAAVFMQASCLMLSLFRVNFCFFLQSIGLAELENIKPGLAEEAVSVGRVVDLIHLTRPSGETIGKVDMTALNDLVGFPFLGITRHALQRVLLGHLPDGGVQLRSRLEGLETHEASGISELRFEGRPGVVRARAVVGADGRRSVVRKKVLASDEANCDWALTWWALADVPEPITPKGEFRMSYSKKQAIYYGEVEDGVTMWSFTCWRDGEIERNPELRAARALKELEGWPEELRNVVSLTPPDKVIEVYVGDSPLQWRRWSRQPGVSLIGDAAHAMLPTLGMGVTSALQDAASLINCIDGVETPLAEALSKYERERVFPTALLQLASRIGMTFIENVLCR
eukprot:jgi/Undpi1/1164/HiC_scaffold_10.g04626.m1